MTESTEAAGTQDTGYDYKRLHSFPLIRVRSEEHFVVVVYLTSCLFVN